jgi:hypothetical protein
VTVFLRGAPATASSMIVAFPSKEWSRIRGAFVERYGPPHTTTTSDYQLVWQGATTRIRLSRYASRPDMGHALIALNSVDDDYRERSKEENRKAKDDL